MTDGEQFHGDAEHTVFVSYSHADKNYALPIIKALEDAGFSVWWDGVIKGGVHAAKETAEVLEQVRAVVVLWSENSAKSHWVQDEATRGRDRQCLVPVSIDGHEPPLGFGQFQFIDISGKKNAVGSPEMQKMLHAVATLHDMSNLPEQTKPPTSPLLNRRNLIIGGSSVVLVGGAIAAWTSEIFDVAKPSSIAVLPFANIGNDPSQQYFSDGLATEIRAELSRNALLQVVGQTSSNNFREGLEDSASVAAKLGVSFLLAGNVRQSGDRLRISAELIEGSSGFNRWSKSFERPLTNIFAVQQEIAAAVATALSAQMDGNGGGNGRQIGGTESVAAFDAFLRGKDLYDAGISEETDRQALAKFGEAIAADDKYAAAYAARSRSLAVLANQFAVGTERRTLYADAVIAARKAVAAAPEFADAHSSLGFALGHGQLNMRAARQPYEKSYALGKGDADILSRYAMLLARFAEFDLADVIIKRSSALDPLNPRTFRSIGDISYRARRYEDAIIPYERALKLSPKLSGANANMGSAQFMLGNQDKAYEFFSKERNSLFGLPGIAIIEKQRGNSAAAEAALATFSAEHGENSLYQQAQVFAQWGDQVKAIGALQRAFETGDAGMVNMFVDPALDPVRETPEFSSLLKKIGFV